MLIRLCKCTGWSAPLLFAYGISRFSYDVAHMIFMMSNDHQTFHVSWPLEVSVLFQLGTVFLSLCLQNMPVGRKERQYEQTRSFQFSSYWKNPKNLDTHGQKIAVWTISFSVLTLGQSDSSRSSLIWVYTVCPDLPVQKLGNIKVVQENNSTLHIGLYNGGAMSSALLHVFQIFLCVIYYTKILS